MAGVPIRVATGYRWYSLLANRHVYEHRSEFSKHESEYNVEMLKGLGLCPQPVSHPVLTLTEAERAAGASRWSGLPSPRVVVHPGGISARRWRLEQYRDLGFDIDRQRIWCGADRQRSGTKRVWERSVVAYGVPLRGSRSYGETVAARTDVDDCPMLMSLSQERQDRLTWRQL